MPKPASLPRWATDAGADITEPLEPKKDIGWEASEKPPREYFNWWQNLVYEWTEYLDTLPSHALTWLETHVFQKGITATNSVANQHGVKGTGNGTAPGLWGVGGTTSGGGIQADGGAPDGWGASIGGAGNGYGARIQAVGTAAAVRAVATGSGPGVEAIVTTGVAVVAQGTTTTQDVIQAKGYIDLSAGGAPAYGAAVTTKNRVTKRNTVVAWGLLRSNGSGGWTTNRCYGCSATIDAGSDIVTVTLNHAMTDADYIVHPEYRGTLAHQARPQVLTTSTTDFTFRIWDTVAGAVLDLSGTADGTVTFHVFGDVA